MAEATPQDLVLPPVVDLDALEHLRELLLDSIGQGAVVLDGSQVERIVTNALVMLLAGAETARRCDSSLKLKSASDAMTHAVERLGMQAHFAEMIKG